jgi:multidrug efflux pump subunit AcrA (membrane-fusion protein)
MDDRAGDGRAEQSPQTVSTIAAAAQEWQPQLEAAASIRAVNGANLSSQASGIAAAIHFESGADVKGDDGARRCAGRGMPQFGNSGDKIW